jgi:hypothetical protein
MNSKELSDVIMMSEQLRGYILDEPNVPNTPQTAKIAPWMGSLPMGEIQQTEDMAKSIRLFEAVQTKMPTMDDSSLFATDFKVIVIIFQASSDPFCLKRLVKLPLTIRKKCRPTSKLWNITLDFNRRHCSSRSILWKEPKHSCWPPRL